MIPIYNARNEEMAEEEYPPRVCFFRSSYDYDSFIDGGKKSLAVNSKGNSFSFLSYLSYVH